MTNKTKIAGTVAVMLVVMIGWYFVSLKYPDTQTNQTPLITPRPSPTPDNMIRIVGIKNGDVITSPIKLQGQARGNWYFEASFPIKLIDGNGKEIGVAIAQAQSDWMTTEFVEFKAELSFDPPDTETGVLIFQKDNPSGLPEYDDERRINVRFK